MSNIGMGVEVTRFAVCAGIGAPMFHVLTRCSVAQGALLGAASHLLFKLILKIYEQIDHSSFFQNHSTLTTLVQAAIPMIYLGLLMPEMGKVSKVAYAILGSSLYGNGLVSGVGFVAADIFHLSDDFRNALKF